MLSELSFLLSVFFLAYLIYRKQFKPKINKASNIIALVLTLVATALATSLWIKKGVASFDGLMRFDYLRPDPVFIAFWLLLAAILFLSYLSAKKAPVRKLVGFVFLLVFLNAGVNFAFFMGEKNLFPGYNTSVIVKPIQKGNSGG